MKNDNIISSYNFLQFNPMNSNQQENYRLNFDRSNNFSEEINNSNNNHKENNNITVQSSCLNEHTNKNANQEY